MAVSQRFGYIDTEVILSKLPDYAKVQSELDELSEEWQKTLALKQSKVDSMWQEYRLDKPLLTEQMKKIRKEKLKEAEDEVREYQITTFGYEGTLYARRLELIKPLQEKVFRAAEKVAKKRKLQFLFDKSADLVMIYTDSRHNYTDYVLEELGLGDPDDTPR